MRMFRKVAIVGVGLIGGSIGLSIKRKQLSNIVVGVSQHATSIAKGRKRGAVDRGSTHIAIVKGADLIIFATPVETILKLAPQIKSLVNSDCLVTDVGSTKKEIVAKLEKLFPRYLGSHPLAGSEKRGIESATEDLFKGSVCIITPTRKSSPTAEKQIKKLWTHLGATVTSMSVEKHDRALAHISHLPHAIAFALIHSAAAKDLGLASGGFKDTTRIASSDSRLWADIFLSNRSNVLQALANFSRELHALTQAIKNNDRATILRFLKSAAKKRDSLASHP